MTFYRQLALNGFERPEALQPLNRWTQNPHIYIRTVRDDGAAVDETMLALVEARARAIIPQWTGNTFAVAEVQRGTLSMSGISGWITVFWPGPVDESTRRCATTTRAGPGGNILIYTPSARGTCGCNGTSALEPHTVDHEFGHALFAYHTDGIDDVMNPASSVCDYQLSAREAFHARVAYSEPVGSGDPK